MPISGKALSMFLALAVGAITVLFALAGPAQAMVEQEPNNTRDSANGPLADGDTWSGVLTEQSGDEDSDYLKFYLTKRTTVTFDTSRSMVLGPNGHFELMFADNSESFGFLTLGDGEAAGTLTDTLEPGKYALWIVSSIAGDSEGMHWQVVAHGDFASWAEVEGACTASKTKLSTLTKALNAANRNLAKAKKKKGRARARAVKKAKAQLATAKKKLASAKSASATACAIEE